MTRRNVHAVIYSHIWALQHLSVLPLDRPLDSTLVVELAINSNLSAAYPDSMKHRVGVGGLLRRHVTLNDISELLDDPKLSIAFAPRPPIPVGALSSSIGLLSTAPGSFDQVIIMVHCMEALQLHAALSQADRFHVLWDLADAPSKALSQTGEALTQQRLMQPGQWGGFHLYTDARRPVQDEQELRNSFATLLNQ